MIAIFYAIFNLGDVLQRWLPKSSKPDPMTQPNHWKIYHAQAATVPEEGITIAEVLREGGYATFHGGNRHMEPNDTDPQGPMEYPCVLKG